MGVNLSSQYRLMAKQLLNVSQIGSAFEQMGCESVAESVRADVFLDASFFNQVFDYGENHDTSERCA